MKSISRLFLLIFLFLFFSIVAGCGGEGDEGGKVDREEFRIPDSLLSPYEKYHLVRDEFDEKTGGVIASEEIELRYPGTRMGKYLSDYIFDIASVAYKKVKKEIGKPADGRIVLVGTKNMEDYMFRTTKDWWYYGIQRGDTIIFEPFGIMVNRHIAKIAITQKIAQMALSRLSNGNIPLWLKESIASEIAGEQLILEQQVGEFRVKNIPVRYSPEEVDVALGEAMDRQKTRIAFWNAYRMLVNVVKSYSMEEVMDFVKILGKVDDLDRASKDVFGISYNELLDRVRNDTASGD
jgi:hypothetical protein